MAATLDEYLAEIECYPTWEKRRWYQRLWDAAIKSVVVVPSASTNSDYATALKLYDEWRESTCESDCLPFRGWLFQRLNAKGHSA